MSVKRVRDSSGLVVASLRAESLNTPLCCGWPYQRVGDRRLFGLRLCFWEVIWGKKGLHLQNGIDLR